MEFARGMGNRLIKFANNICRITAALVTWLFCATAIGAESASPSASDADLGFVRCDPAKVVGSEACTKCHANELQVWQQTPHFRTFDELHRKPEAKAIADKLGMDSVKRNDVCIQCHYNHQLVDGKPRGSPANRATGRRRIGSSRTPTTAPASRGRRNRPNIAPNESSEPSPRG